MYQQLKKIAQISKSLGAEIPLSDQKYSTAKASTAATILHYLRHLKKREKIPTYLAILPVTNPFKKNL